jgi:hypothetical protein
MSSAGKPKKPTFDEFRCYDGGSWHNLWRNLDDNWRCPACGRSKFQLLRYKGGLPVYSDGNTKVASNLIAPLARHHDHSQGYVEVGGGRFMETVICQDCNSAEGTAKRKLGLPSDFSFSPTEIGQFVRGIPHGGVVIDFESAREIWEEYDVWKATNESDWMVYAH